MKRHRSLLRKLLKRIVYSSPWQRFIGYTKKVALPGFDQMPVYDVADFFFTGIQKGAVKTRAQSLAFSFFLALFPAIIFLFSLIPYIPVDNFQNQLLDLIKNLLPVNAYEATRVTIEDIIIHQRSGLLSIGFLFALYFTSNGFMALMKGFNSSYHISEKRSPSKKRMASVVLTFILSTLLILAIVLIIFGEFAIKYLVAKQILRTKTQIWLLLIGKWTIVLVLFLMAISFLYYYAPSSKKRWRFVSPGSTLATVLTILTSILFAYFVNNFGQYNKLYGSIGTLVVIMLWIYFNSLILILGFELNASIDIAKKQVKRE